MTEDWTQPSEALRRIATAPLAAGMRECAECRHRHAKGERCGYPLGVGGRGRTCRCES